MNLLQNMYFVEKGDRRGQFLLLVDFDTEKKTYSVLGFPESEPLYITETDIECGISDNILDFAEKVPEDVYEESKNEFEYRIKHK